MEPNGQTRTPAPPEGGPQRPVQVCAAAAAVVGVLVLLSWVSHTWMLGALGPGYVPMAPTTAGLTTLLAAGVFVRSRWPARLASRGVAVFAAVSVAGISLLIWAQFVLGFESPLEPWLAPTAATVGSVPIGRMSPLTASMFCASAAAFLLELPPFGRRRLCRQIAAITAMVTILIALTVLLSYAAGAPLLYGTSIIPMAALTAVGFSLLAVGVLFAAGTDTWPLSFFTAEHRGHAAIPSVLVARRPAVMFVFLLVAIEAAGFFYLKHRLAESRQVVERQMVAIADLKANMIASWYRERRGDAEVILDGAMVQAQAWDILAGVSTPKTQQGVQSLLESLKQHYQYRLIALYDAQGVPRLSVPSNASVPDVSRDQDFQAALRAKAVLMADLRPQQDASAAGQPVLDLSIWVPVGVHPEADAPAAGVWRLQIDPHEFLYPLVQSWPTDSGTAETLLIRREGDEVVYLNELRHRSGTALTLRLRLGDYPELPAVKAAAGYAGIVAGADYRKVPVLAAVRGVPGTPWFIVAKVDQEEVYAPLRQQAWSTGIILLTLVLLAALGVERMEARREAQWLQQQLASERERQVLAERIVHLNKHASDIIYLADQEWRILEGNDRTLQAYGYSLAELQRLHARELRAPEVRAGFDRQTADLEAQKGFFLETIHQRKDGSTFPVEASVQAVEIGGKKYRQAIIRDVTERKRAEDLQQTHARQQAVVADLGQRALAGTDLQVLMDETVARIAQTLQVEYCKILELLPDRSAVLLRAGVGWHDGLVGRATVGVGLDSQAGYTLQSEGPVIVQNMRTEARFHGSPLLHDHGVVSGMSVIIAGPSGPYGVLGAHTTRRRDFTEDDVHFLQAAANVLALAIQRKHAEDEIRNFNARLERRVTERTAELEAANKELEAFSYSVSHDLRAPLRAIDGFAAMLAEGYRRQLDEEGHRLLAVVRGEAKRMGELIDDLLAFSRLGRREINATPIDMTAMARVVFAECAALDPGRQLQFQLKPLAPARGDPALIRQVLVNLFSNAVKYTRRTDLAEIEMGSATIGNQHQYYVKDNGVGFDMRYADKLFGVFQRLHSVGEFEGTGVGLALVQRIVHRHGGRVWAEGKVGEGAVFYFTLPKGEEGA